MPLYARLGGIMTWMRPAALCLLALAVAACGGSQSRDDDSSQPSSAPAISEEERILAAHMARQNDACEAMCARLTECAIADTRAHAPEQLEGVDVEALAREHRRQCASQCEAAELSVRQVDTIEQCTETAADCEAFVDCLDAVQPREGE